jgi:hypothetical protein
MSVFEPSIYQKRRRVTAVPISKVVHVPVSDTKEPHLLKEEVIH